MNRAKRQAARPDKARFKTLTTIHARNDTELQCFTFPSGFAIHQSGIIDQRLRQQAHDLTRLCIILRRSLTIIAPGLGVCDTIFFRFGSTARRADSSNNALARQASRSNQSMTTVLIRSPLDQLSMNRTSANNSRRRTTRHLFDEEDEPPAKRLKGDGTTKSASQGNGVAAKPAVNGRTNGATSKSTRQKKCEFSPSLELERGKSCCKWISEEMDRE